MLREIIYFAKRAAEDEYLDKYEPIIHQIRKESVSDLLPLFFDREKADKIKSMLESKHVFVSIYGSVIKCWSLCYLEVADNVRLRQALDQKENNNIL